MIQPKQSTKPYVELLPAALLSQRKRWRPVARSLPQGSCLLVASAGNQQQIRLMQALGQSLQQKGRTVRLFSIGRGGVRQLPVAPRRPQQKG